METTLSNWRCFAPGAGSRPPDLAGREELLAQAQLALQRIRLGRSEKSQMLLGLRGVGKTVLLNRIAEQADALGYEQVQLEAPEGRPQRRAPGSPWPM